MTKFYCNIINYYKYNLLEVVKIEYFIIIGAIIGLIILARVFSLPFKILTKLLINIIIGIILMVIVNILGVNIGLHIPFNTVTAVISGIFGIPGVLLLILLEYII